MKYPSTLLTGSQLNEADAGPAAADEPSPADPVRVNPSPSPPEPQPVMIGPINSKIIKTTSLNATD
jgi:hypothetical protein